MKLRTYVALFLATLLVGCATCADARADGLPGTPYRKGPPPGYAAAPPVFNWTGMYVSGGVGLSFGDSSDTALVGDARIGADFQLGNSPFVVGVLAGFNAGSIDFDAAKVTPSWHVGGRAGVAILPTVLVYGGYVYQWSELNMLLVKDTGHSHKFLVGVEKAVSSNVSIGLELGRTHFDNTAFEADTNEVKLRLNLRTGSLFGN